MVYELIKDEVTHFSEQLYANPQNVQEVKVGGVIKSMHAPIHLIMDYFVTETTREEVEKADLGGFYTLLVDDGVGELFIRMSQETYDDFISRGNKLEVGLVCVFEGLTHTLSRKIKGSPEVEVMIFAYAIDALNKETCAP